MNKVILSIILFLTVFAIDDSIFEPGTLKEPKMNLPYNDDVLVKTLVFLLCTYHYSTCLNLVLTWPWMEMNLAFTTQFIID